MLIAQHEADPNYPRDLRGYAGQPPHPQWPNRARIAVQFVLNIEEGAENSVLHGDPTSEVFLSDILGAQAFPNRHLSIESAFEYGSRAGVWRVLQVFRERGLPLTAFACAMALQRTPEIAEQLLRDGHEIANHGLRWISYQMVDESVERAHIQQATEILTQLMGEPPLGWYTGRDSPNTRRLLVEQGGYLYDADSYADDLPYWNYEHQQPHLVIPYALDTNDMRFTSSPGFAHSEPFFQYLKDAFDCLYQEGETQPKMLSIGLHSRIIGRPARIVALTRFLDYIMTHDRVWICRRVDIARHWQASFPAEV
ncbi:MAG: allantoinase PuuE [Pseudomonadota bacterium]|nr:allantoinase PuuE [Pseudomonadota bacterium]